MTDPYEIIKDNDVFLMNRYLDKFKDVDKREEHGFTFLHLAAQHNKPDLITLLINERKINVNQTNYAGDTPIHVAATWGAKDALTTLIELSGIDVNSTNEYGNTALHYACFWHNLVGFVLLSTSNIYIYI